MFLTIAVIFGFTLWSLVHLVTPALRGRFGPSVLVLAEGLPFFAALFSAAVMAKIEKRSLADYGLPGQGAFGARFWQGMVWGFVALTALLLVLRVGHHFYFGSLALSGSKLVFYAGLWAVAFLAVGFSEEFITRGYALFTLATGMGFWPAAILLSAFFGALHFKQPGEDWVGSLGAALIGLFFCLTLRRTGSLWFAIGMHAMWDYSESFIYSVPDSGVMVPGHLLNSSFHGPKWLTGGTVGPEGSALVFLIIAALFVIFDRLYRDVRFPSSSSQEYG